MAGRDSLTYEVNGLRGLPLNHQVVQNRMKLDPFLALGGVTSSTAFLTSFQAPNVTIKEVPSLERTSKDTDVSLKPTVLVSSQKNTISKKEFIKKKQRLEDNSIQSFDEGVMNNIRGLVFKYENLSQEELRARLPRYKYNEKNIKKQLKSLDIDIDAKLSQYLS